MPQTIAQLFASARAAARASDWDVFRVRLAALRDALEPQELPADLTQMLETLGAAACALDPEGCRAELERVGEMLALPDAEESAPPAEQAPAALDLRHLEPPEPMLRIMERLARAPAESLRVRLRHEPVPLYELLAQRGYAWRGAALADGGYELVIERSAR